MVRVKSMLDTELELYAIGGGPWNPNPEPKRRGPKRRYTGSDVGAAADVKDYFCKPDGLYEKALVKLGMRHVYSLQDGNIVDGKRVTVQQMLRMAGFNP